MNKVMVFIGAPYSKPGVTVNVHKSAQEYDWLWQHLGDRIIPVSMVVSSHFQDCLYPRHYDDWLKLCIEMLKKCDILYVLPGASSGKEEEIRVAKAMGIPVIETRDALIEYLDTHPELFDSEVARLRREIGQQLYEARRQGIDFAQISVRQGARWLGAGGRAVAKGAAGILTEILSGTMTDKSRPKGDREETGNPR